MSKKKKIIIILSVVLAAILISVGVTLAVVFGTKKDDTPIDPTVSVSIDHECFVGQPLSTVTLVLSNDSTPGSVTWVDSNITLSEGTNSYEWIFNPTNTSKYNTITGSIEISATPQELESIEINTSASKVSGYYAFEEFDSTGLVINAIYNNGNTYPIEVGFEIVYPSTDDEGVNVSSLRAGDTYVIISYLGKTVEHSIDEVSKISVETPTIEKDYTGEEQTATFEDTELYEFKGTNILSATDVGEHRSADVVASLIDSNNYEWKDYSTSSDIQAVLIINKVNQTIQEYPYNGEYDGNAHSPYVTSNSGATIYYSETELNDENYITNGTTNLITITNVNEKIVYYYIEGTENYNSASGQISITITKATPTVSVQSLVVIETGDEIQASTQMVTITGLNSSTIDFDEGDITFSYYNDKNCSSEVNSISVSGIYYIVATYAGNENYLSNGSEPTAFVVYDESYGLYTLDGEDDFVWESDDSYSLTFEISSLYGLTILVANINDPSYEDETAVLYYQGESYMIDYNENNYQIAVDNDVLTLTQSASSSADFEFEKFYIDEVVGTYTYVCSCDDGEYRTNTLTITYSKKSYYFVYNYVFNNQGIYGTNSYSGTTTIIDRDASYSYDKYIVLKITSSSNNEPNLEGWYYSDKQEIWFESGVGDLDVGTYTKQS